MGLVGSSFRLGCGGGACRVVWVLLRKAWSISVAESQVVGLASSMVQTWRSACALLSHWGQCMGLHSFSMSMWTVGNLLAPSCASPCILVMSPGPFHWAISLGETHFYLFLLATQKGLQLQMAALTLQCHMCLLTFCCLFEVSLCLLVGTLQLSLQVLGILCGGLGLIQG